MAVPAPLPGGLRLRAFQSRVRFSIDQLGDLSRLSERIVDFFSTQMKTRWDGDVIVDEEYIVAKPRAKPYQKQITLYFVSYDWLTVAIDLGVRFSDQQRAGLGSRYHSIRQAVPPGRFSAVLLSSLSDQNDFELVSAVDYVRGIDVYDPIVTYCIVLVKLNFPAGYFETTPRRDISRTVLPP